MNRLTVVTFISLISFLSGFDSFFTTNSTVESDGVAGAEFFLTRFNNTNSFIDLTDNDLWVYLTINTGWYKWSLHPDTRYHFYHLSKGIKKMGRIGLDISFLRMQEVERRGENNEDLGKVRPYIGSLRLAYSGRIMKRTGMGFAVQMTKEDWGSSLGAGSKRTETKYMSFYLGFVRFGLMKFLTMNPKLSFFPSEYWIPRISEDDGLTVSFGLLNMGPHIQFSSSSNKDPQPHRMLLGINYKFFESSFLSIKFLATMEKPLISYNVEKEEWDPFYEALWKGWSNDSSGVEQKDVKYRVGIETRVTKYLTLRVGKYRYPLFDNTRFYPFIDVPKYEFFTWGFTVHTPFVDVSGAFLNSHLPIDPWNARVAIQFGL